MSYSVEIRDLLGNKFRFFEAEVPGGTWTMSVKRFKIEEPDGDGTGNLTINLGVEKTISFQFKLLLTNYDSAVGTYSSTVKTIDEKVKYLVGVKASDGTTFTQDPFLKGGIEDFYFVDLVSHTGEWVNNKVQLDSITFSPNNANPNSLIGSLSFTLGGGNQ